MEELALEPVQDNANSNPLQNQTCPGCQELIARVEVLEQKMASLGLPVAAPRFGTTACYWIVIGIHSLLFAILGASIEWIGVFVYAFLIGAIGTLATCHVFPIRSIIHKFARTLLSATLVTLAGMVPFVVQLDGDFSSLLVIALIYLSPCFLAAWFISKLWVWTRGWRILPPGHDGTLTRTKISDIFVITLIVALYFGACRALVEINSLDLTEEGLIPMLAMIAIAAIVGSLAASLLARGILVPGRSIRIRWITAALSVSAGATVFAAIFFMVANGDVSTGIEVLLYVAYGAMSCVFCLISPALTFALMRLAGYRLLFPGYQAVQAMDECSKAGPSSVPLARQ